MTEVETVMPEASSQPSSTPETPSVVLMSSTHPAPLAVVSTTGHATNVSDAQQLKDQQNGVNHKISGTNNSNVSMGSDNEPMDVDGTDTEEDDSQITSSTENGAATTSIGANENTSTAIANKQVSTLSDAVKCTQNSNVKSTPDVNEHENSNTCDGVSQSSSQAKSIADDEEEDDESQINTPQSIEKSEEVDNTKDRNVDNANQLQPSSTSKNSVADSSSQDEKSLNCKDLNSPDAERDEEPMETSADPLSINSATQGKYVQKENGITNNVTASSNASGFVDLGDDSDDDDEGRETVPKVSQLQVPDSTSSDNGAKLAQSKNAVGEKSQSICSDSDGAVVIASDSDTEASPEVKASKVSEPQVIEDDDDDCVVIEDDSPGPSSNDPSKRKSMAMESPNQNSDDSQPPSKRQRNATQPTLNQITIKDARSLMPQDAATVAAAAVAAAKKVAETNIYPVNITQAGNNVSPGPPKLVPMMSPTPVATFPGLNSNTNLLPGLTDDMFVLEAPSFIVPYIYEKPPVENLTDIVKEIETKYKLSKEDLAEADKQDEFDMMTEQNKEEKEEKTSKKKKRRRDADDSWSEESDEDDDEDDDDDSESGMRTKVLIKEASDDLSALKVAIKPASTLAQSPNSTSAAAAAAAAKPGLENYFESPLGKFFMDIGVGQVQEFVQADLLRLQKRKMRKSLGKNTVEFERAIAALSGNLEASRRKNSPFKFTMKRCEFCNFKSESALAMANHYETPHMNGVLYKCNFCEFEIRNATEIVYHMEAIHNIKARLIKPLPYHQCPNCGFEDNGKAKMARHQPVCAKKFRPEFNLTPPNDWEAPAKIPRIKPRHGLVGTATAYQAMAAQAAAQKAALASIQQQQQQAAQARSMQAAALAAQNAVNKMRGRPPVITKPGPGPVSAPMMRGAVQIRSPMATNVVMPNNYQMAGGNMLQTGNTMVKKTLSGQPSISITPLPRQSVAPPPIAPSTSKMQQVPMKPGQSPNGNNKAQFVICEICDGYIKDLEQLRNHMQWMHKVKIHPKMIYNRPPLNCQKCQFRFFTDQGLERHLLGSHGLVTSSMQEAANKGKDAGRCPVCGRLYQWKLLNHVSRDHHMTLKPAHLSYKCTVCTATFGMYKQFETHVYTAHSTVAKKAMDGKKNAAAGLSAGMGGSNIAGMNHQRSNLLTSNDSLLKPLKINDEITIIPQPASKSRITNMESHIID